MSIGDREDNMAGNYIRTKEIKEKNRKASVKAWENEDFREKQSEAKIGYIPLNAGWNKGLTKKEDIRVKKISESNKKYWDSLPEEERKFTEENKKNIGKALKGVKKTEEHIKNMSESRKGKKQPNISLAKKGQPNKNKGKKNPKISEINKESWKNPETRQRRIEGIKRAWADPDKKHQWVSAANKANSFHKINKIETKLDGILNDLFPNEYKYTGDGSIIIEGKIPDFININGQKKIIELFGNYWHKQEDEQIRKDYFSKYGYETLIIWEEDMKNLENVKNKLKEFNNVQGGGY